MTTPAIPREFLPKMPKSEINQLPITKWEGSVRLIQSSQDFLLAMEELQHETVLGFDTETKPVFRKGQNNSPSLIQLAGENLVLIIQLTALEDIQPLVRLFGDSKVRKVGVGLAWDLKQLQEVFSFQANEFVDLGEKARKSGIESQGLRTMAARFFGYRISKRAQCSNWQRRHLKPHQLAYAATDAWISREIYFLMKSWGLFQ
ncbi:MAG: 3'-5' exonuclease domain-containing protein 2 [Magnetococcus sp. DMHC-6]